MAQSLPFAEETFDAVIFIGSFEMIGDDRMLALREMVRVARHGALIGIAEPMCRSNTLPSDLRDLDQSGNRQFEASFRTLDWNKALFRQQGLTIVRGETFPESRL